MGIDSHGKAFVVVLTVNEYDSEFHGNLLGVFSTYGKALAAGDNYAAETHNGYDIATESVDVDYYLPAKAVEDIATMDRG